MTSLTSFSASWPWRRPLGPALPLSRMWWLWSGTSPWGLGMRPRQVQPEMKANMNKILIAEMLLVLCGSWWSLKCEGIACSAVFCQHSLYSVSRAWEWFGHAGKRFVSASKCFSSSLGLRFSLTLYPFLGLKKRQGDPGGREKNVRLSPGTNSVPSRWHQEDLIRSRPYGGKCQAALGTQQQKQPYAWEENKVS